MTDMAAGFMIVHNSGGKADRLTSVTTPLSPEVTLHITKGTRMEQVASLAIPADGELKLASGGNHLMLGNLSHRPEVGEKITFILHFATSAPLQVQATIKPTTYRAKG
jgi:periplasmic copper chaperone A